MRARLKAMLETEFILEGKIIRDSLSNTSLRRELNDPRFKMLEISIQSVSYHFRRPTWAAGKEDEAKQSQIFHADFYANQVV